MTTEYIELNGTINMLHNTNGNIEYTPWAPLRKKMFRVYCKKKMIGRYYYSIEKEVLVSLKNYTNYCKIPMSEYTILEETALVICRGLTMTNADAVEAFAGYLSAGLNTPGVRFVTSVITKSSRSDSYFIVDAASGFAISRHERESMGYQQGFALRR